MTDLAIILPGRATLTVQSLPLVGLKTAVGLVVSSSAGFFAVVPLGRVLASDWRFRFWNTLAIFLWSFSKPNKLTFAFVSPLPIVLKLFVDLFEFSGGENKYRFCRMPSLSAIRETRYHYRRRSPTFHSFPVVSFQLTNPRCLLQLILAHRPSLASC